VAGYGKSQAKSGAGFQIGAGDIACCLVFGGAENLVITPSKLKRRLKSILDVNRDRGSQVEQIALMMAYKQLCHERIPPDLSLIHIYGVDFGLSEISAAAPEAIHDTSFHDFV